MLHLHLNDMEIPEAKHFILKLGLKWELSLRPKCAVKHEARQCMPCKRLTILYASQLHYKLTNMG